MSDEEQKRSLEDWGINLDKFKERAKTSLESAKGDLTEITGTLRHTLVQAKDVVVGLHRNGSPAATSKYTGVREPDASWRTPSTAATRTTFMWASYGDGRLDPRVRVVAVERDVLEVEAVDVGDRRVQPQGR